MSEQMYPVTKQGHEQLKTELKHLMSVVRPEVVQAIADAREHGDLKENAEYHAAKERQGFVEGRIQELNGKLAQCNVIDIKHVSAEKKSSLVLQSLMWILKQKRKKLTRLSVKMRPTSRKGRFPTIHQLRVL